MSAIKKLGLEDFIKNNPNYSNEQNQTMNAFGYKWTRRDSYDSPSVMKFAREWLVERYCNNNENLINKWLEGGGKIILDAGCGSGYSALALFGKKLNGNHYLGIDISESVEVAKTRFKEESINGEFIRGNINDTPLPDNSIDIIFSEGVLHHTDSTKNSLIYLSKKLKKDGLFLFYVYLKKAVIREFTDDYIRDYLKDLTDEEAWNALYSLTKLGISLGKLNIDLNIEEDIPYLGIKKGKQNLQRFIYWNVFKAFYRAEYSLEEMNHLNYDWYRPLNCHRHTVKEIEEYCKVADLVIENKNIQEAGITVIARKQ